MAGTVERKKNTYTLDTCYENLGKSSGRNSGKKEVSQKEMPVVVRHNTRKDKKFSDSRIWFEGGRGSTVFGKKEMFGKGKETVFAKGLNTSQEGPAE